MLCSAQAAATPLVSTSVDHMLSSTSTATILVILAASWMVLAETSLSAMPPSRPLSMYSFMTPKTSSSGVLGSRRAHSKTSSFLRPPSCLSTLSSERRTSAGLLV
jgi:hypothetical protein